MPDLILKAAREALQAAGATQYGLRQAGIGSATARNLLAGDKPVRSDQIAKALAAYGVDLTFRKKR